jgi:putative salt-induced outer membrane protein YdiY
VPNVRRVRGGVVGPLLLVILAASSPASAQTPPPPPAPEPPATCPCPPPPPPPPVWTGSFGAGLALTQGNKDTKNINLSFDLKRDPKTRTVFKADGLYILATEDGDENVDRALVNGRVEYLLTGRTYTFGQVAYVRDRFKDIDYLIAPTAGLGYKLLAGDRTTLDVDGSVGLVFEKNTGFDLETDGALSAGEKFAHKLSSTATLTQGVSALWKMGDPADALYTFGVGLAASVTSRVQLKLEFQDVYKTRPTGALVDKNDIAFISALVYKF